MALWQCDMSIRLGEKGVEANRENCAGKTHPASRQEPGQGGVNEGTGAWQA